MKLIDGKAISAQIRSEIRTECAAFYAKTRTKAWFAECYNGFLSNFIKTVCKSYAYC